MPGGRLSCGCGELGKQGSRPNSSKGPNRLQPRRTQHTLRRPQGRALRTDGLSLSITTSLRSARHTRTCRPRSTIGHGVWLKRGSGLSIGSADARETGIKCLWIPDAHSSGPPLVRYREAGCMTGTSRGWLGLSAGGTAGSRPIRAESSLGRGASVTRPC